MISVRARQRKVLLQYKIITLCAVLLALYAILRKVCGLSSLSFPSKC